MGFCTDDEYWEFLRTAPEFERMLIRSGIHLVKYWFSVSDEEQERRFQGRINDRDQALEASARWTSSHAGGGSSTPRPRTRCSSYTDTKESPWWVVDGDEKRRARLNCISHLLSIIPYEEVKQPELKLPPRQKPESGYVRPPKQSMRWVPEKY